MLQNEMPRSEPTSFSYTKAKSGELWVLPSVAAANK